VGRISWGNALSGGILFSALMELAKHFFMPYIASSPSYGIIYGSLQTIVVLVVWVYYAALILLLCAELISSYRRRAVILLERIFTKSGRSFDLEERLFRKFGKIYKKGEYVFREGDTGGDIFYVLIGGVVVEKRTGPTTKVLSELGPGQYFGEMAAMTGEARTASIKALEDSEIAVIDIDTFKASLFESHEIALIMLRELSHRIKQTNRHIEVLTQEWMKYAAVLYFVKNWPLQKNQDPVKDLAGMTGKDETEIGEVLREMEQNGILLRRESRLCGFDREKAFNSLGSPESRVQAGLEEAYVS